LLHVNFLRRWLWRFVKPCGPENLAVRMDISPQCSGSKCKKSNKPGKAGGKHKVTFLGTVGLSRNNTALLHYTTILFFRLLQECDSGWCRRRQAWSESCHASRWHLAETLLFP
jgi:hypothetical protein